MSLSWLDKRRILLALYAFILFILAVPLFTYFYFIKDIESKDRIMNRNDTGVLLLDRNNKPFFAFYQAKERYVVHLSDVPATTQQAIISTEDKDFYTHGGFSIKSIVRAFFDDIFHKNVLYGGSTITQQLVKNALLTSRKSFMRKFQEIILANEIERRYSKQEILEMYLNSVYFGEGSFGIEEAANKYFGKSAKNLTLAESALLAGILPAPSQYSPLSGDRDGALLREKLVLSEMLSQKYISTDQYKQATAQTLTFKSSDDVLNTTATHFALMVRDQLIKKYGEEYIQRSGLKVKTTLNLDWQRHAEEAVKNQVENLAGDRVTNGAAVVEDPKTGEIEALVGSKDWNDPKYGKVNMADSPRQPGSSFKPIVYEAALEDNIITPATVLHDVPTTYDLHPGTYTPVDYDGKHRGPVLVRRALANSLNIPAVEVVNKLGVHNAILAAKKLGVTTLGPDSDYGISIVLGAAEVPVIEMTNVYATFANEGKWNPTTLILQVTDKENNSIYSYSPSPRRVLDPKNVFQISSILSDNKTRAEEFGNALTISRTAAVKTGTTNDFKDSWTLGYTPSLTVGVWVGNNDNTTMDGIAGSLGAAPIWRSLMEEFLKGTPVEAFTEPPGIVAESICSSNGLLVKEATSSAMTEFFVEGTEPTASCNSTPANIGEIKPPPSVTYPVNPPAQSVTPQTLTSPSSAPTSPVALPTTVVQKLIPPGQEKK